MKQFQVGDDVKCIGTFKKEDKTLVDPTTVTFYCTDPNGLTTTYVYLTDSQVVRDSQGKFHVIMDANRAGKWFFRFKSTGVGKAADEDFFEVLPSKFE